MVHITILSEEINRARLQIEELTDVSEKDDYIFLQQQNNLLKTIPEKKSKLDIELS